MNTLLGYLSRWMATPRAPLAGFGLSVLLMIPVALGYEHFHSAAVQPIAFNHAKHIASGLSCTDCHAGVQTGVHATLPTLDTCMNCHQTALTDSREEEKIRTLAAAGKEVQWKQLTRMPPHVFFSHRRHVTAAKLACSECHGPVEKSTAPPAYAYRTITMNTCLGCHQQKGVDADCDDCHH
jgi:hypothetical protein